MEHRAYLSSRKKCANSAGSRAVCSTDRFRGFTVKSSGSQKDLVASSCVESNGLLVFSKDCHFCASKRLSAPRKGLFSLELATRWRKNFRNLCNKELRQLLLNIVTFNLWRM